MRVALGQQAGQRRDRRERRKGGGIVERLGSKGAAHFDGHMPELIGKTRFPDCVDVIAGLQDRAEASRPASVDEAEVTAVGPRPQFYDRRRFTMRLDR